MNRLPSRCVLVRGDYAVEANRKPCGGCESGTRSSARGSSVAFRANQSTHVENRPILQTTKIAIALDGHPCAGLASRGRRISHLVAALAAVKRKCGLAERGQITIHTAD